MRINITWYGTDEDGNDCVRDVWEFKPIYRKDGKFDQLTQSLFDKALTGIYGTKGTLVIKTVGE